ncbi:MAG: hypothetical protein ABIO45_00665 [Burkholderiaceae bacterium]
MSEVAQPLALAVVVVFGRRLDRVEAWQALVHRLQHRAPQALALAHVLVYDNSAEPLARPADPPAGCSYVHDPGNGGTAAAYACAVALATRLELDWLLLLDHDTVLPERYFEQAGAALRSCAGDAPAALLPWVCHGAAVVSPAEITALGTIRPLPRGAAFRRGSRVTAIASGSLLHVATLSSLLPIPRELWLDYVDHWIFSRLYERRLPLQVFDAVLQHDLSIVTPAGLSARRLSSVLDGEARFVATLGPAARFAYPVRLVVRMLRYTRVSRPLALRTLRWSVRRLARQGP